MKNTYIYPAVVEKAVDGLGLYFPDIPGTAVLAPDIQTAVIGAKNMLVDRILELEDTKMDIPSPSDPTSIELNDASDRIVYIEVFLPPYRDSEANKSVTVNCTVPQYLRDAGRDAELNFSQLLQSSIKDALGIKQK
ncbi:type II toxin-antitoxin system HicB family antitoxin (plasmid) [Paenibacillus polymyxa]|uniref:type II toxin-antitoxin system HicB family antitoxin n=1 Tax=Paenibacillus polymyxa TaxID=1406 RepID=UPI003B590EF3